MQKPKAPEGFIPFKWKSKVINKGTELEASVNMCPECGEFGFAWNGSGWQDPEMQKIADAVDNSFDMDLRNHWSRFCTGECIQCGCKFWHDFLCVNHGDKCSLNERGCTWHYYYKPTKDNSLLKFIKQESVIKPANDSLADEAKRLEDSSESGGKVDELCENYET
jgi:hypothetical protein